MPGAAAEVATLSAYEGLRMLREQHPKVSTGMLFPLAPNRAKLSMGFVRKHERL